MTDETLYAWGSVITSHIQNVHCTSSARAGFAGVLGLDLFGSALAVGSAGAHVCCDECGCDGARGGFSFWQQH